MHPVEIAFIVTLVIAVLVAVILVVVYASKKKENDKKHKFSWEHQECKPPAHAKKVKYWPASEGDEGQKWCGQQTPPYNGYNCMRNGKQVYMCYTGA